MTESANRYQTGGEHYLEMPIQPWDILDTWSRERQIGFHLGNILKYTLRLGSKDAPEQEARKIQHYAEKLTEVLLETAPVSEPEDKPYGVGNPPPLRMWLKMVEDEGFLQAQHDARLAQHMENAWQSVQTRRRKKSKKPYTKELI